MQIESKSRECFLLCSWLSRCTCYIFLMCVCECMCVVRTYVLRYTRTRQQSQLAMSALSVCFVTCCTRYIVPFNCRQQPPTQLPPNVITPRSSVALSLSLSLPLVFLWTVYNVQYWFCYSLWIELQSVLVSLVKCSNCCIPCKTLRHCFYSLSTLTAYCSVAYAS